MFYDKVLNKIFDKIKEKIHVKKLDDIKILINKKGILLADITSKDIVVLMTCVI